MKKVILAAAVIFAAVAVNAAWNQECFYGKCCTNGILDKECVAKGAKKKPAREQKLKVGRTVSIAGTHFDFDSSVVNPRFEQYLKAKSNELKGLRFTKVIIVGFTDNIGDAAYNLLLSQQRAKAVADNFIKSGVPADKVEHSGRGAANPVADNKTEDGRAQNRRVEITVK